jgi:hypothetical protein
VEFGNESPNLSIRLGASARSSAIGRVDPRAGSRFRSIVLPEGNAIRRGPGGLSGIRPARIISTCLGMPSTGSKTKAVNVVNFQTLGKFVVMEQEFFVGGL